MRRLRSLLALAAALLAPAARADLPCTPAGVLDTGGLGTPGEELARLGELVGAVAPSPRLLRRGAGSGETICAEGPALPWATRIEARGPTGRAGLALLPVRLVSVENTRYPAGGNDGLLWAGRGVSALASAGLEASAGPLTLRLAPEVAWAQNDRFDTQPVGTGDRRWLNRWYGTSIDLPQRFGAGPTARWAPGQSTLRLDAGNVGLGISTENLWFGPGIRNAIAMSNAGPGFPHVFLGTTRPADVGIGTVEAKVLWGRLERSGYMPGATHPLLTAFVLDYTPRWLPRLSVGLARVQLQVWNDLRLRDWFPFVQSFRKRDLQSWYGPDGNNANDNQLASAFARWVFPESGLELYGEWAREDHEWDVYQFIREPDHTQAYTLGMQKVFRPDGGRWVRLQAELTHLQELRPLGNHRGVPVYYTHGEDLSYTYQGQLLGAFIGPGADSQTVAIDVFGPGGRIGGFVERIRRNDAVFWGVIEPTGEHSHDTELALGMRQVLFAGPATISWELSAAYRWSRDFLRDEPNFRAALDLSVPLGSRPGGTP